MPVGLSTERKELATEFSRNCFLLDCIGFLLPVTEWLVNLNSELDGRNIQVNPLWPMWHALQSKARPDIEEHASLTDVTIDGDTAYGVIHGAHNRHNVRYNHIYFKKKNDRWLVDMSPWWAPWGPPPENSGKWRR